MLADVVRRPRAVMPGAAARPRSVHDSEPPQSSSSWAAMRTAPPPQAAPPITGIAHWRMQPRCTPATAPRALASTPPPALTVMAWICRCQGDSSREILAARAEPGPTRDHLPPVPVELLLPNAGDQPREPQPLRTAGCEPALTSRHSRAARRAAAPAAQSEVAAAHGESRADIASTSSSAAAHYWRCPQSTNFRHTWPGRLHTRHIDLTCAPKADECRGHTSHPYRLHARAVTVDQSRSAIGLRRESRGCGAPRVRA